MSDVKNLNRVSREADTRGKSARRKPWAPPSRLDAPPAPPGYKHRWIRASAGGVEDRTNVAGRLREGYEFVRADEYPDFPTPTVDDGRHAGVISVGGVYLRLEAISSSVTRLRLTNLVRSIRATW